MPWYWNLLIVAAVFVVPIWLGYRLSRRWRMPDYFGKIAFILFTLIGGLAICVFSWDKIQLGIDLKGGVYLVYEIQEAEEETSSSPGGRSAGPASPQIDMDQLVAALRRRVNPGGQLGVKIRPYGTRQIEIKVPRSDQEEVDREQVDRLKRVLASVGSLEFRILATDRNVLYRSYIDRAKALREDQVELRDEQDQGQAGDQKDNWLARWVPVAEGKEDEFRRMPNIATRTRLHKGRERLEVLVVNDPFDVMGEDLSRASPGVDERGRPCVNFVLKATGATKFGRLTGSHRPDAVQKFKYQLGIILDRELVTAPEIRSPIFDRGEITGGFDEEKVKELVDVLNSGSLPAALNPQPISERHTGPELGADTIRRGKWSLIVSMSAVFISVIIYYRFPGLVADIALAMNALLLLASMIIINAEFSLAGIAGFALSIGMAVDANVLIFERMREESARGAALRMTIRNGFQRALSAIIDSNLTTLITAVILYSVGTDQVRGFAVTLFLGIILSMYTAIFVARVIFDVAERQRWITAVKMMRALPQTRIDFLGHKWVMIGASVVMILLGLVATFVRGRGLLDIDFTGGVSVETVFKQRQDVGQIRAALGGLSGQERLEDVTVTEVYYRGQEPGRSFFINTSIRPGMSAEEYRRLVQETLQRVFGDRLSRNTMSYQLEGVQAAGSPAKPAPGGLQAPASAAPGRAEAAVLSAALLAQAGQSRPAPEAASDKPADGPAAPGAKPASPRPAAASDRPADTAAGRTPEPSAGQTPAKPASPSPVQTQARLEFDYPIDRESLGALFSDALQARYGTRTVEFVFQKLEPRKPEFQDASPVRSDTWDVRVQLPEAEARPIFDEVKRLLEQSPFFPSSDTIGGEVARQTRQRAVWALLASTLFILLYIWVRFQRITYGLGAVVSIVHDILMALSFVAISKYLAEYFGFSLLGVEPFKINVIMMTAFLTIAGYSLNDTIVIFDRIREVRGKAPQVTQEMINTSINQTLGRTLLTGVTSIWVILTLYLFGGPTIHGFAYAMLIGVITGTYSSIYIAAPFLLWVSRRAEAR